MSRGRCIPNPEPRDPKPGTRNRKPEARNPKLGPVSGFGFRSSLITCCEIRSRRQARTSTRRRAPPAAGPAPFREREFFIDNLLVRIHFIIGMIWRTGLAPWECELPFPGSLISTFLDALHIPRRAYLYPEAEASRIPRPETRSPEPETRSLEPGTRNRTRNQLRDAIEETGENHQSRNLIARLRT